MKKLTIKILSCILTLSMAFGLAVPAFAAEYGGRSGIPADTQEDMDAAQEAYAALSSQAKAIFEASLAYDPEMLEFHTTYVDQDFTPPTPRPQTRAADPMRVLMAELSGLELPLAVLYSLKAMGAGMVASIADGPLLMGEILLAAATASTAVVIAVNWKTVGPKWSKIVYAFQKAFAAYANNVISALNSLKVKVNAEVKVRFDKSASDAVGKCDSNKRHHIMNQGKHNWNKLFPKGPNWNKVAPILIKVLREGKETPEKGGGHT